MRRLTPQGATHKTLTGEGWVGGSVERRLPGTRKPITVDYLGCIDAIYVKGDVTLGVQATSAGNMATRVKKATTECADKLQAWIGHRSRRFFEVWGWRKDGTVRVVSIIRRRTDPTKLAIVELRSSVLSSRQDGRH